MAPAWTGTTSQARSEVPMTSGQQSRTDDELIEIADPQTVASTSCVTAAWWRACSSTRRSVREGS